MEVWILAVIDGDSDVALSAHESEAVALREFLANYADEGDGRDWAEIADEQGLTVILEIGSIKQGIPDGRNPTMLLTEAGDLKCPLCGHEGTMSRVVVEKSWERVWSVPDWGFLDSKNDDTEQLEAAEYSCWGCSKRLELPEELE